MIITTTKKECVWDMCKKDENIKEYIKSKYKCHLCKKDVCSYHTKMLSFSKPTLIKKESTQNLYKNDEYTILCNVCYKIMMEKLNLLEKKLNDFYQNECLPVLILKD